MKKSGFAVSLLALILGLLSPPNGQAQVLLATGTLNGSRAGANADLSGLTYKLENGAPANLLGGLRFGNRLCVRQYLSCSSRSRT